MTLPTYDAIRAPWMAHATCATSEHPDLWFAEDAANIAYAQTLCAECPVLHQCAELNLAHPQEYGIFAGETAGARRSRIRQQQRANAAQKQHTR